jgi:hypothetical protein
MLGLIVTVLVIWLALWSYHKWVNPSGCGC